MRQNIFHRGFFFIPADSHYNKVVETEIEGKISSVILPQWPEPIWVLGDSSVLRGSLTGFFCSRRFPARAVLPVLDWARTARERGEVVMSGFHSRLERDALEIILSGGVPAALALARGIPRRFRPDVRRGLERGLLTLASPFPAETRRQTAETAAVRNRLILRLCARTVAGWASPGGSLSRLLSGDAEVEAGKVRVLVR